MGKPSKTRSNDFARIRLCRTKTAELCQAPCVIRNRSIGGPRLILYVGSSRSAGSNISRRDCSSITSGRWCTLTAWVETRGEDDEDDEPAEEAGCDMVGLEALDRHAASSLLRLHGRLRLRTSAWLLLRPRLGDDPTGSARSGGGGGGAGSGNAWADGVAGGGGGGGNSGDPRGGTFPSTLCTADRPTQPLGRNACRVKHRQCLSPSLHWTHRAGSPPWSLVPSSTRRSRNTCRCSAARGRRHNREMPSRPTCIFQTSDGPPADLTRWWGFQT